MAMKKKVRFVDDPKLNLSDPVLEYIDGNTILINFINNVIKLNRSSELVANGLTKILSMGLHKNLLYMVHNNKLVINTTIEMRDIKVALAKFWEYYILCKHCRSDKTQFCAGQLYCFKCNYHYSI